MADIDKRIAQIRKMTFPGWEGNNRPAGLYKLIITASKKPLVSVTIQTESALSFKGKGSTVDAAIAEALKAVQKHKS